MKNPMNTTAVERALQRLGECLDYHRDVELLLVGGAAGMLTGSLPATRTTTDCDVMVYIPPEAMSAVERAADLVGAEQGLPDHWLNSNVQLRVDALPVGWESRKIWVGTWGRLRVWAASRVDLIAMKVLAGRAQDLEDLGALRLRSDDVAFVRAYLKSLPGRGTPQAQIDEAMELLASLEIDDRE